VNRFAVFEPYTHRVRAKTDRGIFDLPINLRTINEFFGQSFNPEEARAFISKLGDTSIEDPQTFEEQAVRYVGRELYEAFLKGYTIKQWGRDPNELPASLFERIPVRFNSDTHYHVTRWTGIPRDGYTEMIGNILDHPDIEVRLGTEVSPEMSQDFRHLFWSGTIDDFFQHSLSRLRYRTVYWDTQYSSKDILGLAQMNFPSLAEPYTRICEYKYFAEWEEHSETIARTEFSKETEPGDVPCYPLGLEEDRALLLEYQALAENLPNTSFIGRLGTYRYLDMDQVIDEMLRYSERICEALAAGSETIPPFLDGGESDRQKSRTRRPASSGRSLAAAPPPTPATGLD
jgi:UDP-galactopyranose mutase